MASSTVLDHSLLGSINMEDLINTIYASSSDDPAAAVAGDPPAKTAEQVWNDIVAGKAPQMTLEDFLAKAGAVAPADVALADVALADVALGDVAVGDLAVGDLAVGDLEVGDLEVGDVAGVWGFGIGSRERERGKRRRVAVAEEAPMDRVTQQRQRRMIKNRESAARSRERKQAYTVELEALVIQLEEENARLVREEGERSRKRFKKLMENLIPVGEKERPPLRAHRRVHSVGW